MAFNKQKTMEPPKFFRKGGELLAPFFSGVRADLLQARIDVTLDRHLTRALYAASNTSLLLLSFFLALFLFTSNQSLLSTATVLVPVFFMFNFLVSVYQPRVRARQRARLIDAELPSALRHLLIEVKSGIPLYQGLVAVSDGYGAVSDEVNIMLKEINGGKSEAEAIEESIMRSPSILYKRSLWQLLNSLKTGTDIESALEATVEITVGQQLIAIKKYGQELNPYTMLYMMAGIILPSLGITFLMLLSTFTGLEIGKGVFYVILAALVLFHLMFMNVVKTKRPMVRI